MLARRFFSVARSVNAPRHLLSLKDESPNGILSLLDASLQFKHRHQRQEDVRRFHHTSPLMVMLFTKRSTRTRVAAEAAWTALGGHPLFLGHQDSQFGGGSESLRDTAEVLSRLARLIFIRCGAHADLEVILNI